MDSNAASPRARTCSSSASDILSAGRVTTGAFGFVAPFGFLVLWILMPLLFFSFAGSKLPSYLLPCFPALAILVAWGYSGVSVGPSAAAKKARWALLLAFMCFAIPSGISELIWGQGHYALDPGQAGEDLIAALFDNDSVSHGVVGAITLLVWGALGSLVISARMRREMIP